MTHPVNKVFVKQNSQLKIPIDVTERFFKHAPIYLLLNLFRLAVLHCISKSHPQARHSMGFSLYIINILYLRKQIIT